MRVLALLVLLSASAFAAQVAVPPAGGAAAQESACLGCHSGADMRPDLRGIPDEWRRSWHARHDVGCHDCHGGDPRDPAMAMSPERGFIGAPRYGEVPEFCGKCHIGILKNFLDSGHGKALKSSGSGPSCVVCHGAHDVQKADIGIINEKRCSQCHSYDRARLMKEALARTEDRMTGIEEAIRRLRHSGVFTEEEDREIFRIQAEYRTLFHTIDVALVQQKTADYGSRLDVIDGKIKSVFAELGVRRRFAAAVMALFIGLAITIYLLAHGPRA